MENQPTNSKEDFKRLTAIKISIKQILSYDYVKDEGWNPNYLIAPNNKRISRVNLIGFITSKEDNSIALDDSTSNITIRTFENLVIFNNKNIGDLVIIIGKPREFGSERYVVPDIIRKIDNPDWLKVRLKELNIKKSPISNIIKPKETDIKSPKKEEKSKKPNTLTQNNKESTYEVITNLINKKDSGDGASIDELIADSNIENCEKIINTLLEEGEIFEIRPGIVKVL